MPGCKDLILREEKGGGHPAGQELQGDRASPTPSPITSKRRLSQHAHSRCSSEPVFQISQRLSRCLVTLQEVAFAPALYRVHKKGAFRPQAENPVSNASAGRRLKCSPPTRSSELLGMRDVLHSFPFPVLETLPVHLYS